jgi:orotate phosphoribosyltransferase
LFRRGGGGDARREFFGMVIEAVCVIVQYQMDNGRELVNIYGIKYYLMILFRCLLENVYEQNV